MYKLATKNKSRKRLYIKIAVTLVVSLTIMYALELKNIINVIPSSGVKKYTTDAETTSTSPTAQPNFVAGNSRKETRDERNEGLVEDTSGTVSDIPPESQWSKSADSKIFNYTPSKDTVLKSGDLISGESNYSNVSFRLIDDVSGVIAQGSLGTVNGMYSGTFSFSTRGTNGRLDIFTTQLDGTELSNIEIPVRFK